MLTFINSALSTGSSRFLTFELGTGNKEKLRRTFSTTFGIHLIFGILLILIAESIGLWFVCNELIIDSSRLNAAIVTYHFSVFTCFISIIQVPYTASIISHEKMKVYAYVSIIEVCLKLLIVYLIASINYDKLILYAFLLFLVQLSLFFFYRIFCLKFFSETHIQRVFDRNILKSILSYSGWNLWSNGAFALTNQGTLVLINMFFSPAVVAARAIANQINMAANQLVINFRTAVNPQIVKRYASGDFEGSKELLLSSTKFSYFMMLLLSFPLCLVAEPLVQLWLGRIPDYTISFFRLAIVTSLFQVFDTSFYTALYAKGQIKENAMLSPAILFLSFPVIYFLFEIGNSPISLAWTLLVCYAFNAFVIKPILLVRITHYTINDILEVFKSCFYVTAASIPVPLCLYLYNFSLFQNYWLNQIFYVLISLLFILIGVWFFGIDKAMKNKIIHVIKKYGIRL